MNDDSQQQSGRTVDAVVVGAGFAGMYMLHRLRGLNLSAVVFEAGGDVGGTWYWNRYPGARCDIESVQYSYSWSDEIQQEWEWSERYGSQPQIQAYARFVAEKLDLRSQIEFKTRVTTARFDEANATWQVVTDTGQTVTARFLIMATGNLSAARLPDVEGIASFGGETHHTGHWPADGVDFSGKRVAVIGTGSSGVQVIPEIAAQASQLTVFQRTPAFVIPATNHKLDPQYVESIKARYPELRELARQSPGGAYFEATELGALDVSDDQRAATFEKAWQVGGQVAFGRSFNDLFVNPKSNELAAEFVRDKLRETVTETEMADKLTPRGYPIFAKRVCVDDNYYATFNRDNVALVALSETPIKRLVPEGIETTHGVHEFDAIVFATGFDAFTGAISKIDVRGPAGEALAEKWATSPMTYLGVATAGFPNLFIITGPGSPSVLANVIASIEQHVDWISRCLADMASNSWAQIEVDPRAEVEWMGTVADVADGSVYLNAKSWYTGANVPGKVELFLPYVGGLHVFRRLCDEIAADGYRGFKFTQGPTSNEKECS